MRASGYETDDVEAVTMLDGIYTGQTSYDRNELFALRAAAGVEAQ